MKKLCLCIKGTVLIFRKEEMMKYGKQFLFGCGTAFSAWAVLTLADTIDELLLDVATCFGINVFFGLPILMLIIYIIHFIKNKPKVKKLIFWFLGYYALFLPMWYVIEEVVNENKYIIYQEKRGDWIDLNGIEYIFYGFSVLLAFTGACLIFHFVYFIVKKLRKPKGAD